MSVMLGGEKAWKQYIKGDVVVNFQWINGEPAMILFPKVKRTLDAGAFAICLSAAFQYVKSDGYPDLDYMIPQCAKAAKVMGMDATTHTIRRICDAILDGMEDLLKMPPERPKSHMEENKDVIGEAVIKAGGRTIMEQELTAPTVTELREMEHASIH